MLARSEGRKKCSTRNYTVYRHINTIIRPADDTKSEAEWKENVENVHTMHSTQLNAIIWLDATNTAARHHTTPSPSSFVHFPITAKRRRRRTRKKISSHTPSSSKQHQIYPLHLAFEHRGSMRTAFQAGCWREAERAGALVMSCTKREKIRHPNTLPPHPEALECDAVEVLQV